MKFLFKLIKLGIISVVIIFVFIIIIALFNQNPSPETSAPVANPQIECFIKGVSVMTTRENCQKLSIQPAQEPPVVNIQQQKPIPQIQPIKFPDPPFVRCDPNSFGGTTCYKSWSP